jgi:hypothetical protein
MSKPLEPADSGSGSLEKAVIRPLFAAGFVTAFGAHGIAANLGAASPEGLATHLLTLGVLLALYDGVGGRGHVSVGGRRDVSLGPAG